MPVSTDNQPELCGNNQRKSYSFLGQNDAWRRCWQSWISLKKVSELS